MESFLSTLVFILPGFMMYFWVQMMGVNPVVKHTVPEFGAMAALGWIPVVAFTLAIINLYRKVAVTTISDLYGAAESLSFLLEFTIISVLTSFTLSFFYVKFIYPAQQFLVNKIRSLVGKTDLSMSPTVWEEVFFKNDISVVGIGKVGTEKPDIFGCIDRVSRPFEAKRAMRLIYSDYVKKLIVDYQIQVTEIYTDVDAGINIFIYDIDHYNEADKKEREKPDIWIPPSSDGSTS